MKGQSRKGCHPLTRQIRKDGCTLTRGTDLYIGAGTVYTANQQSYVRDQHTNFNQCYQDQTENKQIDTILFDGEVDVVSGDPVYLGPEIFQRRNSIGVQWEDVTRRAQERLTLT